jgi:hypothetical protein
MLMASSVPRIVSFLFCLGLAFCSTVAAQTVSGRVTDAATGVPMADVRVVLLRADGSRVAETVSNRIGEFHIATWNPGPHRLEATHIGYRTTTSEIIEVGTREHVVVHLRLSATAIPLQPSPPAAGTCVTTRRTKVSMRASSSSPAVATHASLRVSTLR